jgi:MOSC domain-containing protein YiiM
MERSTSRQVHIRAGVTADRQADPVLHARLRRNLALAPAERIEKLAALCRQADMLRHARRLP